MVNFVLRPALLLLAALLPSTLAQSGVKCSRDSPCPKNSPCCSQYGECGTGAYCLSGCDPASSYNLSACVPEPVCREVSYSKFNNLNKFAKNTDYLGDSNKYDFVYSGEPVTTGGQLWLTMAENTVGTLVKSTFAMWYGKMTASIKTSCGAGVVNAFILLGNSKDEIDFEMIGNQVTSAQTNWYSQGVTNYDNGKNVTGLDAINQDFHEYVVDWQPDHITWSVDGKEVRTLTKEETWNPTANKYDFPQTPSEVQLSLWPGGLASNGEGTIEWAGGLVNWNDQSCMSNNYYHMDFQSVSIQCYDPPDGANKQGDKSYIYTDASLTNSTVEITDDATILGSFGASGLNLDLGGSNKGGTSNNSVPGLSGAGPGSNSHDNGTSTSNGGDNSGTPAATATGSASTGFVQGNGGKDNGAGQLGEHLMQGSLFAAVVAIVALCLL